MDTNFGETAVVSKAKYPKFEDKYADGITDILDLDGSFLVQYTDLAKEEKSLVNSYYETHNSNIAVASAISAYGRILMSSLLNSTEYSGGLVFAPQEENIRALPDSNWNHSNRQSDTLPIKLRAL